MFVSAKPVDKIQKLSIQTVMQPHFLINALVNGRTSISMLGFNHDLSKSPDWFPYHHFCPQKSVHIAQLHVLKFDLKHWFQAVRIHSVYNSMIVKHH